MILKEFLNSESIKKFNYKLILSIFIEVSKFGFSENWTEE
jgi:hypothetical protein